MRSLLEAESEGVCDRAMACVLQNEELIERSYFQIVKNCEKLVGS